MNYSHLILTDSYGIQEETPSLGKPVSNLRVNNRVMQQLTVDTGFARPAAAASESAT